jgi:hypothetical protein
VTPHTIQKPKTTVETASNERVLHIANAINDEFNGCESDGDDCVVGIFDELHDSEVEDAYVQEVNDDKVLMVTPTSKQKKLSVSADEVVLTVEHKERLLRAERQIRVISKTTLADKFMENEVRKYVEESMWKCCKFITSNETMGDCMKEVSHQFAIAQDKCEHWKSSYAHAVPDALNNRQNNTCQDLKKELIGK